MRLPVLLTYGVGKAGQQRVHSSFVAARLYMQAMNSPGGCERHILTRAAKYHEPLARLRTDATERREREAIAAVWRCGQEDNIGRLAGNGRHGRRTIAVAGDAMRCVDDA